MYKMGNHLSVIYQQKHMSDCSKHPFAVTESYCKWQLMLFKLDPYNHHAIKKGLAMALWKFVGHQYLPETLHFERHFCTIDKTR